MKKLLLILINMKVCLECNDWATIMNIYTIVVGFILIPALYRLIKGDGYMKSIYDCPSFFTRTGSILTLGVLIPVFMFGLWYYFKCGGGNVISIKNNEIPI